MYYVARFSLTFPVGVKGQITDEVPRLERAILLTKAEELGE